ncbi:MAG: DUF2164 domain-containing protein [Firmicutes bacterium]|nr:DUF2164 domain-containing protein [Bacillota bacterium]
MTNRPKLTREEKELLIDRLKLYFANEREEEIGDLQAMLLLDFITAELGPSYYNRGIADAMQWLTEKIEDMHVLEIHK